MYVIVVDVVERVGRRVGKILSHQLYVPPPHAVYDTHVFYILSHYNINYTRRRRHTHTHSHTALVVYFVKQSRKKKRKKTNLTHARFESLAKRALCVINAAVSVFRLDRLISPPPGQNATKLIRTYVVARAAPGRRLFPPRHRLFPPRPWLYRRCGASAGVCAPPRPPNP